MCNSSLYIEAIQAQIIYSQFISCSRELCKECLGFLCSFVPHVILISVDSYMPVEVRLHCLLSLRIVIFRVKTSSLFSITSSIRRSMTLTNNFDYK